MTIFGLITKFGVCHIWNYFPDTITAKLYS